MTQSTTQFSGATQTKRVVESVSGRATGAIFFAGFGSLWLYNGMAAMHALAPLTIAAIGVVFAALLIPAVGLLRSAARAGRGSGASSPESAQMKRGFVRVNVMQWAAILATSALFSYLHKPEFLTPAITFIVGAHLVPLARLFSYRAHLVTGGLLMAWATVIAIAFAPAMMPSIGALGTGLVLLVSAAYTLASAGKVARAEFVGGLRVAGV